MSKTSKIVLLCVVAIVAACFGLSACQSYSFGPVGPLTSGATVNNGSLAVLQDGYLYYVNGMDDVSTVTKPTDNYFGKASVKGSIMKSKVQEDGTLTDTAVVVPKFFRTGYTDGGIYIYGEWIYYVSVSTKTDNKDNVLTSTLEYMRTKTDGTDTQSIAVVDGDTTQYFYTADALVYYDSTNAELVKISYDAKSIGKKSVIAEEVTSVLFTAQSDVVFFTKANEKDGVSANEVYVSVAGADAVKIMDQYTFASVSEGEVALEQQMEIGLVRYDAAEKALYYSRTSKGGDKAAGTYGYAFGDTFGAVDKSKEVKFANSALSSVTPLGMANGLMNTSAAEVVIYRPIADVVSGADNTIKTSAYSAAPTVLFFEGDYMYYLVNNKLMRCTGYATENPAEENLCDVNMNSTWLKPARVGDMLYFINSDESSYLYVINYKSFTFGGDLLKATIASGYIESDKTEDGLLPKFMTEADQKTYISAHPAEEE